ncbi:hypothetical protein BpHYR1_051091 [Brachionus plicatilis]|uniref:WRKY domain-containing protein n=1 Tax=Brachionus plicatilis TaxID=10195 RepID=A0A3M7QFC7_BRAPC|nr:hypothetical protein BpHYR1_051091 [Brachionus plicatilis]
MIDLEETFNESSIDDKSSSANEIGIEIENQNNNSNSCNRPNRRKRVYWSVEIIFNNYNEAVKSIEKKWIHQKTHSTKNGIKEYYKCSINSKCPARMHLQCIDENQNVTMLRNQEDHDHGFISSSKRLRKEIKDKIIQLIDIKVTAPLNIFHTLRKEGFKILPDHKQISNFLSRHRKLKNGPSTINYKQFKDWYNIRSKKSDQKISEFSQNRLIAQKNSIA